MLKIGFHRVCSGVSTSGLFYFNKNVNNFLHDYVYNIKIKCIFTYQLKLKIKKMTQSEIIPGLKVKVQLVAQNIVGQENKIIVRTIETVNDDRVTFKGSNARYYLRSSWMQPLVNGVEFFSGKLTYKIIY